jgi:predicted metal-binding membrane protein
MGIEHGAWCLGCCWALMATLFALGVMSITWTVVIAAVVALEKGLPWKGANRGVALLLIVLALGVALAPDHVPGLTIPADAEMPMDGAAMPSMDH